jgi:hypothetical protein
MKHSLVFALLVVAILLQKQSTAQDFQPTPLPSVSLGWHSN